MTHPLLMKPKAAAAKLGISSKRLLMEIRAGRIRFVQVGQRRYFTEDDLDEWVQMKRAEFVGRGRGRRQPVTVMGFTRSRDTKG